MPRHILKISFAADGGIASILRNPVDRDWRHRFEALQLVNEIGHFQSISFLNLSSHYEELSRRLKRYSLVPAMLTLTELESIVQL